MAKIEICLNSKKVGNYGFFCPVSKLHLTVSNPVGTLNADRVTSYILRGLRAKTLIDMNGVVNLETGEMNSQSTATAKTETPEPVKKPVKQEAAIQPPTEELVSQEAEAPVETKASNKKGGKKADAKTVEETATQSEE